MKVNSFLAALVKSAGIKIFVKVPKIKIISLQFDDHLWKPTYARTLEFVKRSVEYHDQKLNSFCITFINANKFF